MRKKSRTADVYGKPEHGRINDIICGRSVSYEIKADGMDNGKR